ncbi:hypothetical protein MPSEU_000596900 [Mayamaea pseudoterrestris]|nr:hypothetical protein MPSEU_000596900 [Mayamaea pseudoterrestris]
MALVVNTNNPSTAAPTAALVPAPTLHAPHPVNIMSAPRDQEDAPVSVNDVVEPIDVNEQPTLLQHEHELSLALMVPFLLAELNAKRNQVQSLQRQLLQSERLDAAREIELTTIVRARNELHERYNVSLEQLANLELRQEHLTHMMFIYRNHIETLHTEGRAALPIENVTRGETGGESSEHDEAASANEDV